jgi:ABC-type multidrug transport system fused ATPase/permease subunit
MSVMAPILRIRKVLRSIGASSDQADEFADAMDLYPTRREFEQRMEAMFQRWFTRIVFAIIVVVGFAVALIVALN